MKVAVTSYGENLSGKVDRSFGPYLFGATMFRQFLIFLTAF